jgi:hypothetical protein
MNEREDEQMRALLRQSLPQVGEVESASNLWPAMQLRMEARWTSPPWFDWALAGGVAAFGFVFPAAIPVLLYYL